jgi:hypothetical protein
MATRSKLGHTSQEVDAKPKPRPKPKPTPKPKVVDKAEEKKSN